MNHATNCKFCHKPITLEVDDAYAALGDPHKLLPMAACNFCSDIRVERRRLEASLAKVAAMIALVPRDGKEAATLRAVVERMTKNYAEMIARWHHLQGCVWDVEAVNLIMDKPHAWSQVLTTLWSLFKDWKEQRAKV